MEVTSFCLFGPSIQQVHLQSACGPVVGAGALKAPVFILSLRYRTGRHRNRCYANYLELTIGSNKNVSSRKKRVGLRIPAPDKLVGWRGIFSERAGVLCLREATGLRIFPEMQQIAISTWTESFIAHQSLA